jgi:hypothetical protein
MKKVEKINAEPQMLQENGHVVYIRDLGDDISSSARYN